MAVFEKFPKIGRLNRECLITEKIDGTNGLIYITEDGDFLVGSRRRWITPDDDNYGFARWAYQNKEELLQLGPGRHHGEWWGAGIQRRYGLKEKKFSLFNVIRWGKDRPACCDVVPLLYRGPFLTDIVNLIADKLKIIGSIAVPGWMKPEGVVVFHLGNNTSFKVTCENDEKPKGQIDG